jgi:hypothetical protein
MTVTSGNPLSGTDWDSLLRQEFKKPYWADLQAFIEDERSSSVRGRGVRTAG